MPQQCLDCPATLLVVLGVYPDDHNDPGYNSCVAGHKELKCPSCGRLYHAGKSGKAVPTTDKVVAQEAEPHA